MGRRQRLKENTKSKGGPESHESFILPSPFTSALSEGGRMLRHQGDPGIMVAIQYKEPIGHIGIARRQDGKSLAKGDENRNLS